MEQMEVTEELATVRQLLSGLIKVVKPQESWVRSLRWVPRRRYADPIKISHDLLFIRDLKRHTI